MPHSPFLSILGVGLIGFSLYIGLIVSNFQGMGANVQSNFLFHNIGVIVSCLILYFLAKRKIHHKYLSFFIAIAAAFCILLPFLAGESIGIPFQGLGALVVASRAVFAAVGFLLLYSTVPAGREGFFIALVLAAYDLLWTLLSPLLGLVSHMTYLYYICCWMVGVAGILFAATNKQELPQDTSAVSRQTLQLFGLIFLSALCGFLLIGIMLDAPVVVGLLLDVSQPKFSIQLQPTGALYIALLLCFPLAGRLLDRRPDRAIIMCIAAVATVTILKLINIDSKLLGYLLDLVRLFFWISAQTIVAKLFRGRMVLILLIIAVYLLLPMQFVGVALRSVPLIAPLVAAVVIICLFFARRQLLATPDVWYMQESNLQATQLNPHDDKLLSFAAAHQLTAREQDVLQCLLKDGSRETISTSLALSARTVRYHIANLQKKLSLPNERSMIDYYNLWKLK